MLDVYTIILHITMLGNKAFKYTPMKLPINIIGSETKAYLNLIIGYLLCDFVIWFKVLPIVAPKILVNTIMLAYLGK